MASRNLSGYIDGPFAMQQRNVKHGPKSSGYGNGADQIVFPIMLRIPVDCTECVQRIHVPYEKWDKNVFFDNFLAYIWGGQNWKL